MREILFRGKRTDNGEWVDGDLLHDGYDYDVAIWERETKLVTEVVGSTVGQYTGLKDKNGKRIFEGDIVEVVSLNNDHCQRGTTSILCVRYIMGNPCVCYPGFESGTPLYPLCVGHSIKVIGTIHDNPELLEGGETKNAIHLPDFP